MKKPKAKKSLILPAKTVMLKLQLLCPQAGPALVGMLVRALTDLGAEVTAPLSAVVPMDKPDLTGLHVFIDQPVWVRQEEADRWSF